MLVHLFMPLPDVFRLKRTCSPAIYGRLRLDLRGSPVLRSSPRCVPHALVPSPARTLHPPRGCRPPSVPRVRLMCFNDWRARCRCRHIGTAGAATAVATCCQSNSCLSARTADSHHRRCGGRAAPDRRRTRTRWCHHGIAGTVCALRAAPYVRCQPCRSVQGRQE